MSDTLHKMKIQLPALRGLQSRDTEGREDMKVRVTRENIQLYQPDMHNYCRNLGIRHGPKASKKRRILSRLSVA